MEVTVWGLGFREWNIGDYVETSAIPYIQPEGSAKSASLGMCQFGGSPAIVVQD